MLLPFAILAALASAAPLLDERKSPPAYRYIHPANAPEKCITAVPGEHGREGTQLAIRDCVASADQRFRVTWPNTKLRFLADTTLCIDSSGTAGEPDQPPNLTDGRPALLLPCSDAGEVHVPTNGYWDRSDYTHLRLWGTDVCLAAGDGLVHQSACGQEGQEWLFDVVGGAT